MGRRFWVVLVAMAMLAGYSYWSLTRPLPALKPTYESLRSQPRLASSLVWPKQGQAAVGILGTPILETHGRQKPTPTASTAKLVTVLNVLRVKPLALNSPGPAITLTDKDVAIYNSYFKHDGSLVPVKAGEKISQYQVLQTIMLPSANNLADSLAIWAFGSLRAYSRAANQYLASQGLAATHVGSDASGFDPRTTSTAHDLVRIGELAMQNPVLARIANQPTARHIPVAGNIRNVNILLGTDGIVGIKTGNTDQAGGVFVAASRFKVNGQTTTVVTAIAGSPNLWQSMHDSLPLIRSAKANFKPSRLVRKNAVVGRYKLPWGGSVTAIASQGLKLKTWGGNALATKIQLHNIAASTTAGQKVGNVIVPASAFSKEKVVPVTLQSPPTKPSAWWRLTHPF